MRPIELLAPARNLECGLEAIRHGADAVYIGAPRFGARAAAGNSVEDIARLVAFAHSFSARVYVTLNTLLFDDELPAAQALINDLAAAHVDALITQDPRILPPSSLPPSSPSPSPSPSSSSSSSFPSSSSSSSSPSSPSSSLPPSSLSSSLPSASLSSSLPPSSPPSSSPSFGRVAHIFVRSPLPLHSSTQMDNRTAADVRARAEAGYEQVVLARELSIADIRALHAAQPGVRLEAFVHGALCVSYSGRCYASEYCFGRSANRGECAQFCRLPFDLVDASGRVVDASGRVVDASAAVGAGTPLRQRHLLSLRDMNRARYLEEMMDAGVSSFKIEGRLKDVSYVKNVTAYYSQRIDEIIARRPDDYCRASAGRAEVTFTPDLDKSFNRRFTDYFLHGRTSGLACFATPKAIGEPVGTVRPLSIRDNSRRSNSFEVLPPVGRAERATLSNGDGLCFFDGQGRLQGFRVNRVDPQGHIFPAEPSVLALLRKGTPLYRNFDADFERQLARPTADRRIPVRWLLEDTDDGFRLTLTPLVAPHSSFFIPHSSLSVSFPYPHELARTPQHENIRRQLARLGDTVYSTTAADIDIRLTDNWFIPSSVLAEWRRQLTEALAHSNPPAGDEAQPPTTLSSFSPAQELQADTPLMTCRYCLLYELGCCLQHKNSETPLATPRSETPLATSHIATPLTLPLALRLADGRTFPLRFDCRRCEMQVLRPE